MHVTLPVSDGSSMQAFVALPEGKGPFAGLLLFQEAYGINGHIRRVASRLASEGFVVIAPELFHRTAPPGWESPYGDFSAVAPHFQAITLEGLSADCKAAHAWLSGQVDFKRIGSIGFCLGGRVSFIANAVLPLAVGVSYYGGYLDQVAHLAPQLSGPHLFAWGGLDKHIPHAVRDTVTSACEAAGKSYASVLFSYADHAFNCDDRPNFNADASREAWALSMAFLRNRL
jgi:carboxymethylenebutenolidase